MEIKYTVYYTAYVAYTSCNTILTRWLYLAMKPASELIEIVARYTLPLQIFTASLIFIPDDLLIEYGLFNFVVQYNEVISITFLLTISFSIYWILHNITKWVSLNLEVISFRRRMIKYLYQLTNEEKQILRSYLEEGTQSLYLNFTDGIASGLENKHIIYGANPVVTVFGRAYNMQPFAFEYLKKHNWLLEE